MEKPLWKKLKDGMGEIIPWCWRMFYWWTAGKEYRDYWRGEREAFEKAIKGIGVAKEN